MILLIILPGWALMWQLFNSDSGWVIQGNYLLAAIGGVTMLLQIWMVIESVVIWPSAKGVLEEALPSLQTSKELGLTDGRSC